MNPLLRQLLLLSALALSGCFLLSDPRVPTSVEVGSGGHTGPAGLVLTPSPTFRVLDQHGDAMDGVPVTITVVTGGGSLTGAPTTSSASGAAVGSWTLGQTVGVNELEITAEGLTPVRLTATGVAGPPAKLVADFTETIVGVVGTAVTPAPRAILADQFDNPISGSSVTVAVSGGTAPASATTGTDGAVAVADWVLGTVRGEYTLTMSVGSIAATFDAYARSGPPATAVVTEGGDQAAKAGQTLPQAIRITVEDSFGNPADSVAVSFAVTSGGGSLQASSATTTIDGVVTAPAWTLGPRVEPQEIRATVGALSVTVAATVTTAYEPIVRFFGPPMSAARQAHFTSAAARLSGAIIGDLSNVSASALDLSVCDIDGVAPLTETIDDLIIYATIRPIDGASNTLASAGPCYIRSGGGLPVIGVMEFDEADIGLMEQRGIFGDVILHEMLHVLGVGIGLYWDPMLSGKDTPTVAFSGAGALNGCRASGGSVTCASTVPVENTGGGGTFNSHWRESVFDRELMTGYAESGPPMPMSQITIGSLDDIGYDVNTSARDSYSVPGGSLRDADPVQTRLVDELRGPLFEIDRAGRARPVTQPRERVIP